MPHMLEWQRGLMTECVSFHLGSKLHYQRVNTLKCLLNHPLWNSGTPSVPSRKCSSSCICPEVNSRSVTMVSRKETANQSCLFVCFLFEEMSSRYREKVRRWLHDIPTAPSLSSSVSLLWFQDASKQSGQYPQRPTTTKREATETHVSQVLFIWENFCFCRIIQNCLSCHPHLQGIVRCFP